MREERQLAILILVVILIGFAGLLLAGGIPGLGGTGGYGDIYVESYQADLYPNGTLEETFIYEIKESGEYQMLYRIWEAPLSWESVSTPHVEPVSISPPPGTISYTKDFQGEVTLLSTAQTSYTAAIRSLALRNEAGCYKPEKFGAGEYEIGYVFRLHPPLECDADYCHLNVKLADEHLPYKQVTIAIHDSNGSVVQLFSHPPVDVRKDGDLWIITGESPKDTLLEIEMLLNPEIVAVMDGFPEEVLDVEEKTRSANSRYSMTYTFFSALSYALRAMIVLFPAMLVLIYYKYGREKVFTVPKFLSYVPKRRKPWLVNLVFKGDAFDFDENGFYATLLDLQRRGIVAIETEEGNAGSLRLKLETALGVGEGLRIKLLKGPEAVEDEYERDVLRFLEDYAENGVFDTRAFEKMVDSLRDSERMGGYAMLNLKGIHDRMRDLLNVRDKIIASEFVVSGRKKVALLIIPFFLLMFVMLFIFFNLGAVYPPSRSCLVYSFILVLQSIPPVFFPSALFGRYTGDYYKEKLEWDAFKTFLSDFASIRKYAPEDLTIWTEWLVYGTALGVGDKVAEAMKRLNVGIPEAHATTYLPIYFGHAFRITAPSTAKGGGGFAGGGGGFGAGGGFGGGGGGAR